MSESNKQHGIIPVNISEEMRRSFLDYSMSVIVSRALPDVRDGLKPVHRRILYTMHILKNTPSSSYKKSARIVGDAMGRFHPHGDQAIYDALVRLSQTFSMRYPLVDGQGNFGSIDGDPPAAMRYTEVRMDKLATEMLTDIEKDTVDFVPNYDDKEMEPAVLPTRFPNLLVNGVSGIAVGMATNIPPHNMTEIIEAIIALLHNPDLDFKELLSYVKGPDFPTGGFIYGREGIISAFKTGRGRVIMRGRTEIEEVKKDREAIIINEIPYQVNKAALIEKIADLVKNKHIEGISDIRDESDKKGMRIVIFLKKDAVADIILNQLYKLTPLQSSFGVNMIAIVEGRPKLLNLAEMLKLFIEHRKNVVIRRSEYELNEAERRIEIVEGLGVASLDIDKVIELIKESANPDEASEKLMNHDFTGLGKFLERAGIEGREVDQYYRLSKRQARAILDMRLHRLTGLQQEKLISEYKELTKIINRLKELLASEDKLREVIISELNEIKEKYGDERRTEIIEASGEISIEDLIEDEERVITLTRAGYIKTMSASMFKAQGRGGKGRKGAQLRDEEDMVSTVITASSLSMILFFTNTGRVFKNKVYALPQGSYTSRGKALINFLGLQNGEKVVAMLPVPALEEGSFVFFATKNGIVKKTELPFFANIKQSGIKAINIDEGDKLIGAAVTDGNQDILLATKNGLLARFKESQVRPMGRTARGVIGIRLREGDEVVSFDILDPADKSLTILSVSEKGFGKRSLPDEYTPHNRGSHGVITIKTNERNGKLAAVKVVKDDDHLIAFTKNGQLIRVSVSAISQQSRNTQGITIMRLNDDTIQDLTLVAAESEEDEETGEPDNPDTGTVESSEQEIPSGETSADEKKPEEEHQPPEE